MRKTVKSASSVAELKAWWSSKFRIKLWAAAFHKCQSGTTPSVHLPATKSAGILMTNSSIQMRARKIWNYATYAERPEVSTTQLTSQNHVRDVRTFATWCAGGWVDVRSNWSKGSLIRSSSGWRTQLFRWLSSVHTALELIKANRKRFANWGSQG